MTWTINLTGHDDFYGQEDPDGLKKIAYEVMIVEKARALAAELAEVEGGHVTVAQATTNTHGTVGLLDA